MKEFEPSPDFTEKTMMKVRAYENTVRESRPRRGVAYTIFLNSVLKGAGAGFCILNLARLYFEVFAPAVCR